MKYIQEIEAEKEQRIDMKDKKILFSLGENARVSFSQLAKKTALSNDGVKYRFNNLIKKGIVQGFRTVVNLEQFGYGSYHLFLRLNKLNKDIEESFVSALKKYSFVRSIIKFSGYYDFEIALISKDIKELDANLSKILNKFSDLVFDHTLLIITKRLASYVFPKNFIETKGEEKAALEKEERPKIDKTDVKLLNLIAEDVRFPVYKIAEKINLSADAVTYRLKKLINQNVIKGFVPVINFSVIGYSLYTVLFDFGNLSESRGKTLESFFKLNKDVLWAVKTLGKYNLLVYLCVKSSNDFHNFINDLRNLFSSEFKGYEVLLAYEQYKYVYLPKGLLLEVKK